MLPSEDNITKFKSQIKLVGVATISKSLELGHYFYFMSRPTTPNILVLCVLTSWWSWCSWWCSSSRPWLSWAWWWWSWWWSWPSSPGWTLKSGCGLDRALLMPRTSNKTTWNCKEQKLLSNLSWVPSPNMYWV